MKKNYGYIAANWWCKKIEEENPYIDSTKLNQFKNCLASKIDDTISLFAHANLSTYSKGDFPRNYQMLADSASSANLPITLPVGYEMTIFYDTGITVYNNGVLIGSL